MNQTHNIRRNALKTAAAFAMTLAVAFPCALTVNAGICFEAGAGIALGHSPFKTIVTDAPASAKDAASETDADVQTVESGEVANGVLSGEVNADAGTVSEDDAVTEVAVDVQTASDNKEEIAADAAQTETVDISSVSGNETRPEGLPGADDIPVLTVGAGSVIPDSSIFSEEEMQDEFAEEEAAGGAFGYTQIGVVQVDDHLNVRASAEDGSKIVGKMEKDSGCEILDVKGKMAHITSGSVEGYVNLDYLVTGPEAVEYASNAVKETATVNADGLKLREDKSLDAPVYNMVAYGEQLEVVEKTDDWIGVKYDGRILYVSAEYVSVGTQLKTALNMTEFLYGAGVSDVRMELCEYAKKFVGNPYVWGGTSLTKGADCSGFVMSVFAKYGISLPHSSRAQANCGTRIKMSEARPGDLVFYAKGKRINHVGIYIGGGQIVNASSPRTGIRIANAYYRTPVAVVRILQD